MANLSNVASSYIDEERFRHWSPESQVYAPVDVLDNYLRTGWVLDNLALVETFFYGGYRRVDVFCLTLRRAEACVEMHVLRNPRLMRLIDEHGLSILSRSAARSNVD